LLQIISQIFIASGVFISTFTKNDPKKAILQKNMRWFFYFLGNVLIGVHTTYINFFNNLQYIIALKEAIYKMNYLYMYTILYNIW